MRDDETGARRVTELRPNETIKRPLAVSAHRTNTIRLMGPRPLTVAELPVAEGFEAGSAVPLPAPPDGAGDGPLERVADALRALLGDADERLLVTAHGPDEALAARRALALEAVATGDADAWVALTADADVASWQRVLAWVARARGWACDPGQPDGKAGPNTTRALQAFRQAFAADRGRPMPAGGAIASDDWRAFLDCYGERLAQLARAPISDLWARARAARLRAAVSCGAHWPVDRVRITDHAPTTGERVDVLVMPEAHAPLLACHSGPVCEPNRCDVYRKAKYRRRELVGAAPAAAGIVRLLLTGMLFDTDKTFLLPSSLTAIRALRRLYDHAAPRAVLVVGHTDRKGRPAYNLDLSRRRAEAIKAFLADDVERWLTWFSKDHSAGLRWGTREEQHMLALLSDDEGPFYTATVDGLTGPATTSAVKRFQAFSNARRGTTLAVNGVMSADTRRALVATYMATDGTTLPPDAQVEVHGCGESHRAVETDDEVREQENRRVEVFFFPEAVAPPAQEACPPPAGCGEHAQWVATTVRTIDLRQGLSTLRVLVQDDVGEPAAGARVVFESDEATTDEAGLATFTDLLPGPSVVRATKKGFQLAEATVDVPEGGAPVEVTLKLAPRVVDVLVARGGAADPFARLVLRADDGSFERTLSRADAQPFDEARLLLRFREVLDGVTYTLTQVLGEGVGFDWLRQVPEAQLRAQGEVPPEPGPVKHTPAPDDPPPPFLPGDPLLEFRPTTSFSGTGGAVSG